MDADDIDTVIKCAAFITLIAGPPGGPERNEKDNKQRRWVWFEEEENDSPVICLVLNANDYRVEIDFEAIESGHPRYYTVIGWCAMHRVPCYITMGDDHWMRVTIEANGDSIQHAH